MRLLSFALLLLAACSKDGGDPSGKSGSVSDLPDIDAPTREFATPPFTISLDDEGELRLGTGAGTMALSLKDLGAQVERAVTEHAKSHPLELTSARTRVSKLDFLLRVHPDAPVQHVQFLLAELESHKVRRIWFATAGGGAVHGWLPLARGMSERVLNDKPPPRYRIEIRPTGERQRDWGQPPRAMTVPTEAEYRVGRKKHWIQADDIAGWFQARAQKHGRIRAEVRYSWRARAADLILVLAALEPETIDIDYFGTAVALPEIRVADRLPYPELPYGSDDPYGFTDR